MTTTSDVAIDPKLLQPGDRIEARCGESKIRGAFQYENTGWITVKPYGSQFVMDLAAHNWSLYRIELTAQEKLGRLPIGAQFTIGPSRYIKLGEDDFHWIKYTSYSASQFGKDADIKVIE